MQTHIKAREIFFQAMSFIQQHIIFSIYYFFLMFVSEILQVARTINLDQKIQEITHAEGYSAQTSSFVGTFWATLLSPEFSALLQKPYAVYIIFALTFAVMILFVSITFLAQALLRKRDTSIMHEVSDSFSALMRAPWAIIYTVLMVSLITILPYFVTRESVASVFTPFVFLPLFGLLFLFMFISVPLYYYQQLLYDRTYSFKSVLHTSWSYVKKSWFVVLKFIFLIGVMSAVVMMPFGIVSVMPLPVWSVMLIQFILRSYLGLVSLVGLNLIYTKVRS